MLYFMCSLVHLFVVYYSGINQQYVPLLFDPEIHSIFLVTGAGGILCQVC